MTTTETTPATMTAVTQSGYGGVEVLRTERRARPAPDRDEVLVRVMAMSPDSGTVHLMKGDPYAVRLALGLRRPRQQVIGLAFAGVIEQVGSEVRDLAVGDRVAGTAWAACAEFVVASPAKLARIPDSVTMVDASTLPVSAGTALQAVRDSARVRPGQSVLVIGAGGGVGAYLVQLAVDAGARVTGLASAAKAEFVRSLGAERVIDYRAVTEPQQWGRFDVVVDTADGRPLHVLRRALSERGTLVIVGADKAGGPLLRGADRQARAMLVNPWVRHRLVAVMQRENGDDIAALLAMLADGRLRAPVDEVVPVERTAEVMQRLADQQIRGKAVIEVARESAPSR